MGRIFKSNHDESGSFSGIKCVSNIHELGQLVEVTCILSTTKLEEVVPQKCILLASWSSDSCWCSWFPVFAASCISCGSSGNSTTSFAGSTVHSSPWVAAWKKSGSCNCSASMENFSLTCTAFISFCQVMQEALKSRSTEFVWEALKLPYLQVPGSTGTSGKSPLALLKAKAMLNFSTFSDSSWLSSTAIGFAVLSGFCVHVPPQFPPEFPTFSFPELCAWNARPSWTNLSQIEGCRPSSFQAPSTCRWNSMNLLFQAA